MRCLLTMICVLTSLLPDATLFAQPIDAAARAKVVSPFVDEQTMAVGHVTLSRIDVNATLDRSADLLPLNKTELANLRQQTTLAAAGLRQMQVDEIYFVVSLADLPSGLPFAVVPLAAGTEAARVVDFLRELIPQGEAQQIGNVVVVGLPSALKRLKTLTPASRAGLPEALAAAGDTAAQLVVVPSSDQRRVIEELMPKLPSEFGGGATSQLGRSVQWAAVGIDSPPAAALRLTVQSTDAAAAEFLRGMVERGLTSLMHDKSIPKKFSRLPEFVQAATPRVEEDRLVVRLDEKDQGVTLLLDFLRPAFDAARTSRARTQSVNNLKQLALTMHIFHDQYSRLPAAASYDAAGRPLLSWRVHLLPYLDLNSLYEQFRLNEPWDSAHNRQLIDKMPELLRSLASNAPAGRTTYLAPVGKGTVFEGRKGLPFKEITDGLSNTIMLVEADDEHSVVWTRPDDLPIDPREPFKGLVKSGDKVAAPVAMCDGSVRLILDTIDKKTLAALLTRNGDEPIGSF